jgi:HTH-type transcriptional regulator, competence development regulator
MNKFGDLVRTHRESNEMFLRHLAAKMDMDTAQLSKIERGERIAKKEHVILFSSLFGLNQSELLMFWLADQAYNLVETEKEIAIPALEIALNELKNT